ncbi:MAG: 50S ribosomal protein L17 [Cyanobacteria bacterium]|nr:50S ribosomal protein L17 [Cyanobacteriota bacterium]MDA1021326.1 50S ribosomal protein L17 [Cyanobacteriota bacterium]
MRHQIKKNKMNRPADQRKAALRALATCLLREKQINTTMANAKAVAPEIDRLIGLAVRGDLHARRQVASFIYDKDVVKDLFANIAERYKERKSGGFTRIVKDGFRRGDNVPKAIIQLV